jgi:hypothetical protein
MKKIKYMTVTAIKPAGYWQKKVRKEGKTARSPKTNSNVFRNFLHNKSIISNKWQRMDYLTKDTGTTAPTGNKVRFLSHSV